MFRDNDLKLLATYAVAEVIDCPRNEKDVEILERCAIVDQTLAADFNQNDAGWLRNDIAALAAAQTKEQYDMIARRLIETNKEFNVKDGQTVKDAVRMIRPRYAQTPTELVDFADSVASGDLASIEALKVRQEAIKQAKENSNNFVASDAPVAPASPAAPASN